MGIHIMPPLYEMVIKPVVPPPPEWTLIIAEPWTIDPEPPDFTLVIEEPWTS